MSNQPKTNSWESTYRKCFLYISLGFIFAVLIMLSGWLGWFNNFFDKPEIWFQRSGSLMTTALLFADYFVYKLLSDVMEVNMIPPEATETKDRYRPVIRKLPYLAVFLTALATFVWGYGDLELK